MAGGLDFGLFCPFFKPVLVCLFVSVCCRTCFVLGYFWGILGNFVENVSQMCHSFYSCLSESIVLFFGF